MKKFWFALLPVIFLLGCATPQKPGWFFTSVVSTNAETIETNLAVSPHIKTFAEAAKRVSGFVPGYGGIIEGVVGILFAGLGWYAKLANAKAKNNYQMLTTVISGVETAADAATKIAVMKNSVAAGTQQKLDAIVQSISQQLKT